MIHHNREYTYFTADKVFSDINTIASYIEYTQRCIQNLYEHLNLLKYKRFHNNWLIICGNLEARLNRNNRILEILQSCHKLMGGSHFPKKYARIALNAISEVD